MNLRVKKNCHCYTRTHKRKHSSKRSKRVTSTNEHELTYCWTWCDSYSPTSYIVFNISLCGSGIQCHSSMLSCDVCHSAVELSVWVCMKNISATEPRHFLVFKWEWHTNALSEWERKESFIIRHKINVSLWQKTIVFSRSRIPSGCCRIAFT